MFLQYRHRRIVQRKTFCWFYNWFHLTNNDYPRIFNSKGYKITYIKITRLVTVTKLPDDRVIYYMIPKGLAVQPQETERLSVLDECIRKGMKEAVHVHILYERD